MLDDDGCRRKLARLRTQRTDAAKKVETANAELDDEWLFTAQRTLELAKSAAELWVSRSGAEKRMLLEMMVSNPTLTGRKVAYELKKPFAVLDEIRRKGVGRALVEEFRTAAGKMPAGACDLQSLRALQ
jgi:GNAT superfamily N-acetyltransferase